MIIKLGCLPMDAPIRGTLTDRLQSVEAWEFCYILNARQMGKSSLVRMMSSSARGFICAAIDMTRLASENITPAVVQGLMVELWQSFDLLGKVNLKPGGMSKRFIARPVLESIYRRYPSKSS